MSPSDHADFDALSAYVDGEAPEWADHVAGCEACRATVAELRSLSAVVGGPADLPMLSLREGAIAAALGAMPPAVARASEPTSRLAPDRHDTERARFARRRSRPWAMPAVAAAAVAVLGMSGVLLSYRTSDNFTAAGPALESDAKATAPQALVADLGEVPDAASLRARVQAGVASDAAASTGRSSSSSNSGAPNVTGPLGVTGPPNATSGAGGTGSSSGATAGATAAPVNPIGGQSSSAGGSAGAPAVVGTRPCEEQARTREPSLGPVVSFATARRGGVESFVLGFAPVGATSPVTLLLLAQDGCRELLRSAGP